MHILGKIGTTLADHKLCITKDLYCSDTAVNSTFSVVVFPSDIFTLPCIPQLIPTLQLRNDNATT